MQIPKYDEIRLKALELLQNQETLKLKDFELPLAKKFSLSNEQINQKYASGKNAKIFYDRIGWALSYLNMSGLVEKPKRGHYKITSEGKKMLKNPEGIENYISLKLEERNLDKNNLSNNLTIQTELSSDESTPTEAIELSFGNIKNKIYNDILDTILTKTPREFEKLVVQLLQKMGYGGEIENSGEVTQYSNDNGIDGIIKEDVLGFGRIYIQAKRYKQDNKIGREDLNKFVGALAVAQSNKGVFITTSSFNKNAIEYANSLNNSITLILIDGEQLAEYIYDYSLGMQTEQIIEIKKLDSDFWDSMEDDC